MKFQKTTAILLSAAAACLLPLSALAYSAPESARSLITAAKPAVASTAVLTAQQARNIAQQYVPSGNIYQGTDERETKYEVNFYSETNQEFYELEVSKSTQKVVSYETKLLDSRGGARAALGEEGAKKAVLAKVPKAQILSVKLDYDDGYLVYEVRFSTDTFYGTYDVHAESGKILKRDVKAGQTPSSADTGRFLSYEKIKALALQAIPNGAITDVDLDRENGAYVYELEVRLNGREYDLVLDAFTGKVLWNEYTRSASASLPSSTPSKNTSGSNYIGAAKAKEIALARNNGKVVKCKLDKEDGEITVYDVTVRNGRYTYEYEIDAVTGAILDWDEDFDDDYDD